VHSDDCASDRQWYGPGGHSGISSEASDEFFGGAVCDDLMVGAASITD